VFRKPNAPPKSRSAFSRIASNTGARSPGEELMSLQHLGGRGLLLQRLVAFSQLPPRLGKLALKIGYELFADRPMYC
jgi:hypothetical protein